MHVLSGGVGSASPGVTCISWSGARGGGVSLRVLSGGLGDGRSAALRLGAAVLCSWSGAGGGGVNLRVLSGGLGDGWSAALRLGAAVLCSWSVLAVVT